MTGQLKITVLDASPTSRKILEVILLREGHQVACFGDALQALRFLSQYGPTDLLFLALELPGMDGFDVLKYLRDRAHFQAMGTIVLLNRHDGVLVRLKARLAGAQQVVRKPLVGRQIVALVSAYLDRGISLQEADQRTGVSTLYDNEMASNPGRSGCDGTASSHRR